MDYLKARDGMVAHNVHPSIIAAFDVLAGYAACGAAPQSVRASPSGGTSPHLGGSKDPAPKAPGLVLDQPGGNLSGETNTIGDPSGIGEPSDVVSVQEYRDYMGKFTPADKQDADGKPEKITHAVGHNRRKRKRTRRNLTPRRVWAQLGPEQ